MNIKLATLVVILIATAASYGDQKHPLKLCGRWKSNETETGYWIIDRHPDGTFAEKWYYNPDYVLPGELILYWGKWSVSHRLYQSETLGTTSVLFFKRLKEKERPHKIVTETPESFEFAVVDGTRTETRLNDHTPLSKLNMPAPQEYIPGKPWHDTTQKPGVPDWVRDSTGIPVAKSVVK